MIARRLWWLVPGAGSLLAATLGFVACGGDSSTSPDTTDGSDSGVGFVCPPLGISKGPWSVAPTETSIKIRWEACRTGTDATVNVTGPDKKTLPLTSVETPFVVNNTYGAPLAPNAPKDWAGTYYMHEAVLTGLSPSTCYDYVLSADSSTSARFCTARKPGEDFRFLVIGDTNPTLGPHTTQVLSHVVPMNPDFTLHGGDIQYYDSTLETWAAWFPLMSPLLRVGALQASIGNHESEKPDEYQQYTLRFFGSAGQDEGDGYYRFSSGGITYFSINTQDPVTPSSTQGQWLLQELATAVKAPGFRASVVFFHKPFLTCGDTGDDTTAEAYWAPIFVQYKVPLVFQAHMHGYERFEKDGVTWITTAGGGGNIVHPDMNSNRPYCADSRKAWGDYYHATIVDVSAAGFTGRAIDTEGATRDTFTVPMPGSAPGDGGTDGATDSGADAGSDDAGDASDANDQ